MTRGTKGEDGAPAVLTLDNIGELVTIREAAAATRLSEKTIRHAIVSEALRAFIPGKPRSPLRAGRGNGYRIHRADLQQWFFAAMRGES